MREIITKNKTPNQNRLLAYGFSKHTDGLVYSINIAEDIMRLNVCVKDDKMYTEVTDTISGDEYVLHGISHASGAFVGQIRAEYNAVIDDIISQCFDTEVFKCPQTLRVIDYIWSTYGDKPEFLWQRFPDNAVIRRKDTKKWYAALLTVSRSKLGFESSEAAEILDIRMNYEKLEQLVDGKKYFPGYHMNKKHWITVCLDGTVSDQEIFELINASFMLAAK